MKYLIAFCVLISVSFINQSGQYNYKKMTEKKPLLFYFGDPMCSWCYGFSPELSQALETLGESVELKVIMGGLRPYNTETMADLEDFLKDHWEHVQEASGQDFNYGILKDHSFVYDTEPPSRAVLVARSMKPEITFDFFKAVQKAFYVENKNTHDIETYLELANQFGLDKEAFKKSFESEEAKEDIRIEFEYAASLGVRGFPTVILKRGEEDYTLISNGYQKAEQILAKISKLIEN